MGKQNLKCIGKAYRYMKFIGIRRLFSTENEMQYNLIGAFWDEMSKEYGRGNLCGLGFNWKDNSIEYAIGLKEGLIAAANFEIDLPDKWDSVYGRTEKLADIYNDIYRDGALLYEIEEFDDEGNCQIKYYRR